MYIIILLFIYYITNVVLQIYSKISASFNVINKFIQQLSTSTGQPGLI